MTCEHLLGVNLKRKSTTRDVIIFFSPSSCPCVTGAQEILHGRYKVPKSWVRVMTDEDEVFISKVCVCVCVCVCVFEVSIHLVATTLSALRSFNPHALPGPIRSPILLPAPYPAQHSERL